MTADLSRLFQMVALSAAAEKVTRLEDRAKTPALRGISSAIRELDPAPKWQGFGGEKR